MGIASSIKNCFQEESTPTPKPIVIRDKIINDDFEYFSQENWYRFRTVLHFDPNKFIFLYSGYAEAQRSLLQQWKIVDLTKLKAGEMWRSWDCTISNRWKHAIRRGVPIYLYKNMIEMMFQNRIQKDFSKKYQGLFDKKKRQKQRIKPNTFQQQSQEIFRQPFLNDAGEQALKRITFLISANSGQLEYNPFILTFVSMLLIFVPESTAYLITNYLVQSSFNTKQQNRQNLRYHFTLTEYQFQKLAQKFYKKVKKISPTIKTINSHLNTEGIEKIKLFKEIVGNFFFGYLPFGIILKVFMHFLNEGIEIMYRVFYALLKVAGPNIRDSNNNYQILRVIKSRLFVYLQDEKNVMLFFRYAFDLKLETNQLSRINQIQSMSRGGSEQGIYYLPTTFGGSEILSYQCVQQIWSFLPEAIKQYNLRKLYPEDDLEETLSLKKMLKLMQPHNFTLIVIQCLNGQVLGVFIADKIKVENNKKKTPQYSESAPSLFTNESDDGTPTLSKSFGIKQKNQIYFGSSESFIFTLAPHKKKYSSTGHNIFYCSCNENYFIVGGPADRPALQFDSSLTVGLSYQCPTYGNTPLHYGPPGEFCIQKLECFSIQ